MSTTSNKASRDLACEVSVSILAKTVLTFIVKESERGVLANREKVLFETGEHLSNLVYSVTAGFISGLNKREF